MNWVHFLLLLPAAFLYTIMHEAFHGFAVIIQGGRVTEFSWIPTSTRSDWGYVRYEFERGVVYSGFLISIAPYMVSVFLCGIVVLVAIARVSLPPWLASTIFIWLFLVPLADLAYASIQYILFGSDNDLFQAFGHPRLVIRIAFAIGGCVLAALGYIVQNRLYGTLALSMCAYLGLGTLAAILLLVVARLSTR